MARLHRALAQFMLDTHINEHGLTETMTPVLVREEAMFGTNQLPKFSDDSYQTTNGWWLIPTSEVTLTNTSANAITLESSLPIRMTAHTQCFRSEAALLARIRLVCFDSINLKKLKWFLSLIRMTLG